MISIERLFPHAMLPPSAHIAELPTPLERVDLDLPCELWIKRDDKTSARYGGNKVRKLDLLLGQALAEGRKTVLTFGAYGSNHALATAVHARARGLEPHVVLSPQEPGPFAPATLLAHAALGSTIYLVDGWDGRREAVEAKRQLEERDGIAPYVIPMGGTNALGAIGYVDAAFEMLDQLDQAPDVVYVPAGTLATLMGLAVGFAAAGTGTHVAGVRVTPEEVGSDSVAERLGRDTAELLASLGGGLPTLDPGALNYALRHDWFEPGYGIVTPETVAAVELAASAGIKLETTYTGKAFAALMADAAEGRLDGRRVVFVDTYNSAPMPTPGAVEALPPTLQDYIARCTELFGNA